MKSSKLHCGLQSSVRAPCGCIGHLISLACSVGGRDELSMCREISNLTNFILIRFGGDLMETSLSARRQLQVATQKRVRFEHTLQLIGLCFICNRLMLAVIIWICYFKASDSRLEYTHCSHSTSGIAILALPF